MKFQHHIRRGANGDANGHDERVGLPCLRIGIYRQQGRQQGCAL